MKTSEIITTSQNHQQDQTAKQSFFGKDDENSFFSEAKTAIQTKPFFDATEEPVDTGIDTLGSGPEEYGSNDTGLQGQVCDNTPVVQTQCEKCKEEEPKLQKQKTEDREKQGPEIQEKPIFESENTDETIQAKSLGGLTIGEPDDKYEQEADDMADHVVQRLEETDTPGEEEETEQEAEPEIQQKPIFESEATEESVQPKTDDPATPSDIVEASPVKPEIIPVVQNVPLLQPKCEACEKEEENEQEEQEDLKVQKKPVFDSVAEPPEDENPDLQRRALEMEKTDYPILFKRTPDVQLSSGSTSESSLRERIVKEAQKMVGKIEARKDDGSGRRVGADHLLKIFHLAAKDEWSDEVIENVRYTQEAKEFPHWCGIFSVYAIKKAGIDLGYWQMGRGVSAFGTLESTEDPQPGDIGYFTEHQHHCIIKAVNGDTIDSIDGNSGNFSEVKERTRSHSQFHAFFTPFTGSEKIIQKKEEQTSGTSNGTLQDKLNATSGKGASMDKDTRSQMESGFGADFGDVKIHTGNEAEEMNKTLHAQAFTHKNDIYFNEGKYDPNTSSGKHLLAHELTHTVQQGATESKAQRTLIDKTPAIQKQDDHGASDAAEEILDALEGYTSRWDSEDILNEFQGKGKSQVEAILQAMKSKAGEYGSSASEVVEWLFYDMTEEDGRNLRDQFIRLKISDVNIIVARAVEDLLSGFTSESNSREIMGMLIQFSGAELDEVLRLIETEAGESTEDTADWLFDDLAVVHAENLRVHFLSNGGLHASQHYGAYFTAQKIYDLLSGYTSHADSSSILSNFDRTPSLVRSIVLYELDKKTGTDWGERGAADALMQDMDESDYVALAALEGMNLPEYDYEAGWLEGKWEGFLSAAEWVVVGVEYVVCGLVGIITGLLSVVVDIVILIVDLVKAVYNLLGSLVYLMSGGAAGSAEWLAVKEFFKGLGQLFSQPGTVIEAAWNEIVMEGTLIEGPFENCKEAEFWTRKFVNLVVNIILIFVGGYGAVKGGASAVKTIATVVRANGFRKGLVKLGAMVLEGTITTITGLGDDVIRVIRALKTPAETLGKVRQQLNIIKLAATDEGYWNFLRRQAGTVVQGEKDFWREYKESWQRTAATQEERALAVEQQMSGITDDIEAGRLPEDVDTQVDNLGRDTRTLDEDVTRLQEEVTGTRDPLDPQRTRAEEPEAPAARPERDAPEDREPVGPRTREDANTEQPVVEGRTNDGQHGISITENGNLRLCSYPCNFLREAYGRELADNPALRRRLDSLENSIQRELAGARNQERLQNFWEQGRQLQAELEAARLRYIQNLNTARTAFPGRGGALTQIESELAAVNRQDLFEVINDVARLQARDGKVVGFDDWIVSTARNRGDQVVDMASELLEARRLAAQYAQDGDIIIQIGQDALTSGRSFDIAVQRAGAAVRQVEIFNQGAIENAGDLMDGVVHGAEKIPNVDEIVTGRVPFPNETFESTVIIQWPNRQPIPVRDGPDIVYSYSGYYTVPSAQNPAYSGNLATDLVRRLNGHLRARVDPRINALTSINIVDNNGNLIWRLRNNPVGANWQIEFIVAE